MDIILLAALTAFIFYKLSKHLGRVDEEEKREMDEKVARIRAAEQKIMQQIKQQEVVVGSSSTATQTQNDEKITSHLNEDTKRNLNEIFSRCNVTPQFFMSGAKSAFEIILKSFASGDLTNLKMLLSDKIYQGFEGAVNYRKEQGSTLTTNLISIEKAEITSAMMMDNFASIAVKFVSKQINYITDKNGMVIEGRKDGITEVTDIWTFKKDMNSSNPNWVVSATAS